MLLVVVALRSVQLSVLTGMVAAVGGRFSGASWCQLRGRTLCGNSAWIHTTGCATDCQVCLWCERESVGGCWIVLTKPSCASRWVRRCRYALRVGQYPFLFSFLAFLCRAFWTEGRWTSPAEEIQCPANLVVLGLSWWLRANAEVP